MDFPLGKVLVLGLICIIYLFNSGVVCGSKEEAIITEDNTISGSFIQIQSNEDKGHVRKNSDPSSPTKLSVAEGDYASSEESSSEEESNDASSEETSTFSNKLSPELTTTPPPPGGGTSVTELETEIHQQTSLPNNEDFTILKEALKMVKLDTHLSQLISQLDLIQSLTHHMQARFFGQEMKFINLVGEVRGVVDVIASESVKLGSSGRRIETEMEKMQEKLDGVLTTTIQSSVSSHTMFDLSKESLLQMEKIGVATDELWKEVKAVKGELGDVGQASIQVVYDLHKLEENLVAKLDGGSGNRTFYALRQDASSPTKTEHSYYSNRDEDIPPPGSHNAPRRSTTSPSSIKKLSPVEEKVPLDAAAAAPCLSRKRLINDHPKDCGEIQLLLGHSSSTSGIHTIYPEGKKNTPRSVRCDLSTNGGGWTIIQSRREDSPQEDFYRSWQEYRDGFGSENKDQYWLGLEALSALTETKDQELSILLTDWDGETRVANYAYFRVSNETGKYRLHVSDYSGTAGDSLTYHNGMAFSTKDQDNDADKTVNCAERYKGGWWYKNCHQSNLNGMFQGRESHGRHQSYATGINYYSWHGYYYSLQRVEMRIRNRFFSTHGYYGEA